uniref:Uncharacterized protein n=1 Tax=Arundo donax TaxID=35708 RepID=A0A0A9FCU3_ARUDO
MQEQATAFARTETRSSAPTPCEYDSHHWSHGIGGTGANGVDGARSSNLDDKVYQMEHSFTLSGEHEKPYTYICSMLADRGIQQDTKTYIQGKIKVHLLLSTLLFICKLWYLSLCYKQI